MEFTVVTWILIVQNPFQFENTWCFNECTDTIWDLHTWYAFKYTRCRRLPLHILWLYKWLFIFESTNRVITVRSQNSMWLRMITQHTRSSDSVFAFELNLTNLSYTYYCSTKRYIVHCTLDAFVTFRLNIFMFIVLCVATSEMPIRETECINTWLSIDTIMIVHIILCTCVRASSVYV